MQFSTGLLALALAAAGVSASPNPLLAPRQAGVVYVRFYPQANCGGDWLEDTVYFDDQTGTCRAETLQLQYASWKVERNEATRNLNVYSGSTCNGPAQTIAGGNTPCTNSRIGSVQFS
jgi:hypothetical protein